MHFSTSLKTNSALRLLPDLALVLLFTATAAPAQQKEI
jgi:hypothetical protein